MKAADKKISPDKKRRKTISTSPKKKKATNKEISPSEQADKSLTDNMPTTITLPTGTYQ